MDKEEIKFWILCGLVIVLAFVVGMSLQKDISEKEYTKVLKNYVYETNHRINQSIQRYSFNLTAYAKYQTDEKLKQPFACVLGDGEIMEDMYINIFIPALNENPVCFVNNGNQMRGNNTNISKSNII